MTEAAPTQRSRGMRDVLPDEMEKLRFVEEAFARVCSERGYREIRTPVIEPLHLFTSAGTLSPQALDRVYSFLDWDGWSGERVVLRPDSTIPAARLYAEQLDSGRVAKLYYSQNVFRFTDDGSSREEWQCGVELMGDTGAAGDVELAFLALDVLAPLGLPNVTVRLSHAGLVRAALAGAGMSPDEQSAAYDRLLDGDLSVVDEVEARLPALNAGLRLLFEVAGEGSCYLENLRAPLSSLPGAAAAIADLSFVARALEARGVRPLIEAVLARSFEYYSGVILRIDADGQRILGGGRYDDLIGLVGGKRVPALGFALYLAPTVDLVRSPSGRTSAPVIVVSAEDATPTAAAAAHDVGARLRTAGARVETIEGMHSAPSRRLVCRANSTFTLESPEGSETFDRIDDVIAALELRS